MQKRELVPVERGENLAAEVVGHEALISAERPHGPRRIVDGPQPQPREDERRRPALGALDEHLDLLRAELEMTENHEQLVRLAAGEREIGLTHLGERAGGAQTCELERRIDARDEDDVRVRRKVREGVVDRRQAFLAGHRLQVVEHDDQLPAERGDVVEELVDRASTGLPATPSRRSAPRPSPGRTRSTAVATYRHSSTGSLSPASSTTHAGATSRLAHQSRTAVVLP